MQSAAFQSDFLHTLIVLAIFIRIVVIARCIVRGDWGRYGFFCVMAANALIVSIVALVITSQQYGVFWTNTRWLEATVMAAAAIEAFWGLAGHFRNIRGFGWALISVILAASAGAAAILGMLRLNWSSVLRGGFLAGQFVSFSLMLTALLSAAFFRQFPKVPVRPNAILHLRVLALLLGLNSLGYFVGQITRTTWPFTTSFLIAISPIAAYLWWLIGMKPSGEILPFATPVTSGEEYEAAEAAHKKAADQLKQAGSDALENTFRPSRKAKRGWRFWQRR